MDQAQSTGTTDELLDPTCSLDVALLDSIDQIIFILIKRYVHCFSRKLVDVMEKVRISGDYSGLFASDGETPTCWDDRDG